MQCYILICYTLHAYTLTTYVCSTHIVPKTFFALQSPTFRVPTSVVACYLFIPLINFILGGVPRSFLFCKGKIVFHRQTCVNTVCAYFTRHYMQYICKRAGGGDGQRKFTCFAKPPRKIENCRVKVESNPFTEHSSFSVISLLILSA